MQFVTFVQNLFGSDFWICNYDVFDFYRIIIKFDWMCKFCRTIFFNSIAFILILDIRLVTNKFVFGCILYSLHVLKELAIFVIILETWLICCIWFIFTLCILVVLWLDSIILLFLLLINFLKVSELIRRQFTNHFNELGDLLECGVSFLEYAQVYNR